MKLTAARRRARNAYMRVYMRRRYRRLKLQEGRKRFWSPEAIEWLHHAYPNQKTSTLALAMGRKVSSVYQKARGLGLEKTREYLDSPAACRLRRDGRAGVAYRYPKGHVPANKGLRRPGWASGRMKETQFKKGVVNGRAAQHLMPLGATRLVDGYVYVKVAAVQNVAYTVNWKPLHILTWERANGRPLPKSHCLAFRDGNRTNVELDNLELISRAELMRRNTVHNLPKPLAEIVQLRGALIRQINRREKKNEQQQQQRGQRNRGPARDPVRHAARSPQQGKAHGDRPRQGRR